MSSSSHASSTRTTPITSPDLQPAPQPRGKFDCDICNKVSYVAKSSLDAHKVEKHGEGQAFYCRHDGKRFVDISNFRRHMKDKHQETAEGVPLGTKKSFSCPRCQKAFPRNDNMKRHQKKCQGPTTQETSTIDTAAAASSQTAPVAQQPLPDFHLLLEQQRQQQYDELHQGELELATAPSAPWCEDIEGPTNGCINPALLTLPTYQPSAPQLDMSPIEDTTMMEEPVSFDFGVLLDMDFGSFNPELPPFDNSAAAGTTTTIAPELSSQEASFDDNAADYYNSLQFVEAWTRGG